MKKRIGLIGMITYLCLGTVMLIIYLVELRTWIPEEWGYPLPYPGEQGYMCVEYEPRKIADHFVFCFFGIYYLLLGYLLSERNHYYECVWQQERKKARLWMGLAMLCQMGAVCAYAALWLSYTDRPQIPARTPKLFMCDYYLGDIFNNLPETILEDNFKYNVFSAIVLSPIAFYLMIYIIHFIIRWIQCQRQKCLDKVWRNWNLIYIFLLGILLFWACDAQMYFPVMENTPILRELVPYLMPKPKI